MVEIINSWATPFGRSNRIFPQHDEILKLARLSTTQDDRINNRFVGGVEFLDDPIIVNLKQWILSSVYYIAKEVNNWKEDHTPIITDMWSWSSNDYNNLLHGHANCSWSGIYCVEDGNGSVAGYNGTTVMFSPLPWGYYKDPGNDFLNLQFLHWHHLVPGDLLLFPSYVKHSAKYTGQDLRTVIGFDIAFK